MELDVATPEDPQFSAGNICFWHPHPEAVADELLRDHQILVSGYSGRIRISTHLYNDENDVERLCAALGTVLGRG